jgi:hypothetical protein
MSGTRPTRFLKAKVITDPNIAGGTIWKVRLNPTNLDLNHPGNTLWFLEFDNSAVVGRPFGPTAESDLERSMFELRMNADVTEHRGNVPGPTMTVAQFFTIGAKHQPGAYNNDTSIDPNGNIGDPTSVSSLC